MQNQTKYLFILITQITDNNGNLLTEQSFDAWGRMRNHETWEIINNYQLSIINSRGYTGHEMLPTFALINMNGRLYDPVLGRMLSPDNYIQTPDFTQNFNRYSYAFNNPLKYTDPSGDFMYATIIGFAVGFYVGGGLEAGQANGIGFDANPFDGSWKGTEWYKGAIIGGIAGAMIDFYNGNHLNPDARAKWRRQNQGLQYDDRGIGKLKSNWNPVPVVDRHISYYFEGNAEGRATDGSGPLNLLLKTITADGFIKTGEGSTLAKDIASGAINARLNSFRGNMSSDIHGIEKNLAYKFNVNVNGYTIPIKNSIWQDNLPIDGANLLININLKYGKKGYITEPHGKISYKMKASALHRSPYELRTIKHPRTRSDITIHKAKRPWNDALPLSEGGFISNLFYYKKLYNKNFLDALRWILNGKK